jgi:hypothetical protein
VSNPNNRMGFFLLFPLPAALALVGCGDRLGTYEVGDVRLVTEVPSELGIQENPPPYREFVRIELTSKFNLTTADTGAGLYVDADFCPVADWGQMIAFGPLDAEDIPVKDWRRNDKPVRRHEDGRYHYTVYLVPSSKPRKPYSNASNTFSGYDLRRSEKDVCLRFFIPGYNITTSASDTIKVPRRKLKEAFADVQ